MERGLTKQQIFSLLVKSPHGQLAEYGPLTVEAAKLEPEFLAHLISWNQRKGEIRDAKVALPVASLACGTFAGDFAENSLAHVLLLPPREILRAYMYSRTLKPLPERVGLGFAPTIVRYLRELEASRGKFERVALTHRASLRSLYALMHLKPGDHARKILWPEKEHSALRSAVRGLETLTPENAAAAILKHRIPVDVVLGAMKTHVKHPDVMLAIIEVMSPTQLVTKTKMLERWGMNSNPALRGAYDAALKRATEGKTQASKRASMKAASVAEHVEDQETKAKLQRAGEKMLDRISVEGDWAILVDRSPSMHKAIEIARWVADAISRLAKGAVHVVFFDGSMYKYLNATGKTYDEVKAMTKGMSAGGSGTSIGVGLQYLREKGIMVDGVAIVSDGGENATPIFPIEYPKYCAFVGKDVPVYLYYVRGESRNVLTDNMQKVGHPLTEFDANGVDRESMPNLVQTMRTSRFGLVEEVMESRLLKIADVL